MSDLASINQTFRSVPVTPLSFSLLITSPIRHDLPFAPVSAIIFPLGRVNLPFAGLVVAGLDIFISFLIKRSLVAPPSSYKAPNQPNTVVLTLSQLAELIQRYSQGEDLTNILYSTQAGSLPTEDEPLFPDNLSFALSISGPLGGFDETPDSTFNVPLFELPGVPGNLIVVTISLIAQFLLEQANGNLFNGNLSINSSR